MNHGETAGMAAKERKERKGERLLLCDPCTAIRQHHAFLTRFPVRRFTGKIGSQGNDCQGNGKKRFFRFIPLTIIPLTSLRLFPSAVFHPRFGCGWPRCVLLRLNHFLVLC